MKFTIALSAIALASSMPAMAEDWAGDADAGRGIFLQCQTCHVVKNDDGETLAGNIGMVGPNLYGVADAPAGSVESYPKYSPAMKAAKDKGLVWTEENMVAYVTNPNAFLTNFLEDPGARGSMPIGAPNAAAAANVSAFLKSVSE